MLTTCLGLQSGQWVLAENASERSLPGPSAFRVRPLGNHNRGRRRSQTHGYVRE